jgi:hypothetical protein
MDIAQFRVDFPEFSDAALYTDNIITYWSNLGEKLNSQSVYGDCWINAVELYTAHYITIQKQNIQDATFGLNPGQNAGAVSMKQLGDGEIQYDAASSAMSDGGQFNQTWYGRQYMQLVNMFGQGCIQL